MTTVSSRLASRNPYFAVFARIGVPRRPVLTAVVFAVTALAGVAQLVSPGLYDHVRRDATAIDAGEWWRLVTGMFFQDGWALGLVFNLVVLAVFGVAAEQVFGRGRWLVLYFGCGLFGQTMSYLWLNPAGAGNSMCVAGLLGALTTAVLLAPSRFGIPVARRLWLGAFAVPALAVVDTLVHDNHGLPALLGMALAFLLLPRSRPRPDAQLAG
ncbi:rhomboid family intramembrane serine protease [Amycolatopsis sp. NPDC059021]|uniref:rhomboid family intramembrane serine protease n=1 Tax=Amycolatopsis sp. NPDC059021 TaxID=3346704 RepID=UPI0036709C58